jgi:glycerol-3-phosphate dehydrogenase
MPNQQLNTQVAPVPVKRVLSIPGGAFGTALALSLNRKCPDAQIHCWVHDPKEAKIIEEARENTIYLKGYPLPPAIHFTSDLVKSIELLQKQDNQQQIDLILITVPVQFMAAFFTKYAPYFPRDTPIVLLSKGIDIATQRFPIEIAEASLPPHLKKNLCAAAGPSFASEIAKGLMTCLTTASHDIEYARRVQRLLSSYDGTLKCFACTDINGLEITAAAKNVIAILSGVATGLGYGLNARNALCARGLKEIGRLARAYGSNGAATFGLAAADLFMTASSLESRNFTVGYRIGKGENYEKQIKPSMKAVQEGVTTTKAIYNLAHKLHVEMPLCFAVYEILYNNRPATEVFKELMQKPLEDETSFFPVKRIQKLEAELHHNTNTTTTHPAVGSKL